MRLTFRQLAAIAVLNASIAGPNVARAQEPAQSLSEPITWKLTSRETLLKQGTPFSLTLTATIPKGWHLYGISPTAGGPIATHVTLDSSGAFELVGSLMAREPERARDPSFDVETATYSDSVTIAVPMVARASGSQQLRMTVEYQSCTDRFCAPPRKYALAMPLTISASFAKVDSTFALMQPVPNGSVSVTSVVIAVPANRVSFGSFGISRIVLVLVGALVIALIAAVWRAVVLRKER